jgi:hypothetical protein
MGPRRARLGYPLALGIKAISPRFRAIPHSGHRKAGGLSGKILTMSKSHTSATGYNARRNAVMASNEYDPLKLYYLVILGTDAPTDVTPFQGFSTSWRMVSWALEMLTILPADVLERSYAIEDAISQRMGGLRPLSWVPFNVSALEAVTAEELGVFIVLFSGEKECAERIAAWTKAQMRSVMHISTHDVGEACHVDNFTFDVLQAYCVEALKRCAGDL